MRPERKAALRRQPLERWVRWAGPVARWSRHRRRLCLSLAGLGVLIGGAWVGGRLVWSAQTAHGLAALRVGMAAREPAAGAVGHLEAAAEHLAGRPRQLALWYLGRAAQQHAPQKALQAYRAMVADAPPAAAAHYLVPFALLKLGQAAERAGDLARARRHYSQAADRPGPAQAAALWAAAQLCEHTHDPEQARLYYRRLLEVSLSPSVKALVEYKLVE